jgi:hypothetical protein
VSTPTVLTFKRLCYGIRPAKPCGVAAPVIQSIARDVGRNPVLASVLWATGAHEA